MDSTALNTNTLAFIALCNEYCVAMEQARESEREDFVRSMLRLLPRIYISATDLKTDSDQSEEAYLESALEEDYNESVRCSVENMLGPDDVYLEVFEDDMKYSDTPIAASVSEGLADIFQVLYNFVIMVKESPEELVEMAVVAVKDEFQSYWGQRLCNVMRALHSINYDMTDNQ